MWQYGTINGAYYEAKVFDIGSQFGIDGGRISKLHVVKNDRCIINYDRGWDITPADDEARDILRQIIERYNEEA